MRFCIFAYWQIKKYYGYTSCVSVHLPASRLSPSVEPTWKKFKEVVPYETPLTRLITSTTDSTVPVLIDLISAFAFLFFCLLILFAGLSEKTHYVHQPLNHAAIDSSLQRYYIAIKITRISRTQWGALDVPANFTSNELFQELFKWYKFWSIWLPCLLSPTKP